MWSFRINAFLSSHGYTNFHFRSLDVFFPEDTTACYHTTRCHNQKTRTLIFKRLLKYVTMQLNYRFNLCLFYIMICLWTVATQYISVDCNYVTGNAIMSYFRVKPGFIWYVCYLSNLESVTMIHMWVSSLHGDCGRKRSWPNFKAISCYMPGGIEQYFSQNYRRVGRDSNLAPLELNWGVLTVSSQIIRCIVNRYVLSGQMEMWPYTLH
jgi:hypothetical protein